MAISMTLSDYLASAHIDYDILKHKQTTNSIDTAYKAHISLSTLAKAVVLQDDQGAYLMAVVPSHNRIKLNWISKSLARRYSLASEKELKKLFRDCELGAIPAVGSAYSLDTICDEQLLEEPCVYIEGGDHQALIKLSGDEFARLMQDIPHDRISTMSDHHNSFV